MPVQAAPKPELSTLAAKVVREQTETLVPQLVERETVRLKDRLFEELIDRISTDDELLAELDRRLPQRNRYFGSPMISGDVTLRSDLAKSSGSGLSGFAQSGSGAITGTVSGQLQKFTFLSDWTTSGNYDTAKALLTGTMAVPALEVIGGIVGNLIWPTDNASDIGASGATRPRSIYWGTQLIAPQGVVGTPAITFASRKTTGIYAVTDPADQMGFAVNGVLQLLIGSAGANVPFGGTLNFGQPADVGLVHETGGALGMRSGTTAQIFNHYGTFTSSSNYSRLAIKHAVTTLASVTGATVTAASLIPAKANVMGVNTRVTVALGTGGGTTGYTVGDGVTVNRWGVAVATGAGTDTDQTDATADPTGWFTAANNVVITATGGNFNGTGSILVDVAYLMTEAD